VGAIALSRAGGLNARRSPRDARGKKRARLDTYTDVKTSIRHEQLEADEVMAWRQQQLRDAGFHDTLAAALARDCGMDLHALIELVERGCPFELAARILAPLEDERRPC
jgi:hypothetical protein